MSALSELNITALVGAAQSGFSLDQAFYCDNEIFHTDFRKIFSTKWILVDHASRIEEKGQYFLFEIANESIIITRESPDQISAYFNVCRHRGSRICSNNEGRTNLFVCPYHGWSYGLDGSLIAARLMPEDFDPQSNSLHRCHVKVFHDFIFINLSEGDAPDFDKEFAEFDPFLESHGFKETKVAFRKSYPTDANWKLVVENFLECYHCVPSHPEFCSLHDPEALVAMGAGPSSGPKEAVEKFAIRLKAWEEKAASLGRHLGGIDDGATSSHLRALAQRPHKEGILSETPDGKPVAPLMGSRKDFDGGRMYVSFGPFNHIVVTNDFAIVFRFTPRDTMKTDVDLTWLVDKSAEEIDIDRMIWAWDVTTLQDKKIIEDNQAGIRSSRYRPGQYSKQENRVVTFVDWYLHKLCQ